jgi:hypothetical protein
MTSSGRETNFFDFELGFKPIKEEKMPKQLSGKDLLATLVNLLAEQEGVKITYEISKKVEQTKGGQKNA